MAAVIRTITPPVATGFRFTGTAVQSAVSSFAVRGNIDARGEAKRGKIDERGQIVRGTL